ncbi:MAG: hypothetical protein WCK53_00470 [Methanomicrobiales archaeon]
MLPDSACYQGEIPGTIHACRSNDPWHFMIFRTVAKKNIFVEIIFYQSPGIIAWPSHARTPSGVYDIRTHMQNENIYRAGDGL